MAPTRPDKKTKKDAEVKGADPSSLLQVASVKLEEGDLEAAHEAAQRALDATTAAEGSEKGSHELPALNLLGHIYVEAGDAEEARACFLRAAALDADGTADERAGGGAEKFLWLAQLSEAGGRDSVEWFERGAAALRNQIRALESGSGDHSEAAEAEDQEALLEERKRKLAGTLCGMAEVYMTDLSWEADAEQRCEALVTEATMVAPALAEAWQTVANVRISQQRVEEARAALKRSLEIWQGLPSEHPDVPDFPTRVSLARLLMEVEMERESLDVLEQLVGDDDESVEAWYLGGWGQYLSGEKLKAQAEKHGQEKQAAASATADGEDPDDWRECWRAAQHWLAQCLKLYAAQEYEDDRLGEHAKELLALMDKEIGPAPENAGDEEEDGSDDGNSDEDQQMTG